MHGRSHSSDSSSWSAPADGSSSGRSHCTRGSSQSCARTGSYGDKIPESRWGICCRADAAPAGFCWEFSDRFWQHIWGGACHLQWSASGIIASRCSARLSCDTLFARSWESLQTIFRNLPWFSTKAQQKSAQNTSRMADGEFMSQFHQYQRAFYSRNPIERMSNKRTSPLWEGWALRQDLRIRCHGCFSMETSPPREELFSWSASHSLSCIFTPVSSVSLHTGLHPFFALKGSHLMVAVTQEDISSRCKSLHVSLLYLRFGNYQWLATTAAERCWVNTNVGRQPVARADHLGPREICSAVSCRSSAHSTEGQLDNGGSHILAGLI